MKKRLVTMVLALAICFGFTVQNVNAASCPPHTNTKTFSEPLSHWTTTHKVYRNLYVDGKQVYSVCTVSYNAVRYSIYCMDCNEKLHVDEKTIEKHSLASDPDHK